MNELDMAKEYRLIAGNKKLPYDKSASHLETICGWTCNVCRRYFGDEPWSERVARSCCAESVPCEQCGASNPPQSYCRTCAAKREADRYQKAQRVEWDGETPLSLWDNDTYFFSPSSLAEWIDDDPERTLENTWLCICTPVKAPMFDVADWLNDCLPEDGDLPDGAGAIERTVNEWLKSLAPLSWYSGNTVPTLESLRRHLGIKA
jgi:hypothetical protein